MTDTAIRVENLSKRYRIGLREPYKARRDVIPTSSLLLFAVSVKFAIRTVSPAAYCLLVFRNSQCSSRCLLVFRHSPFAIRNVFLTAFCLLPTEAL